MDCLNIQMLLTDFSTASPTSYILKIPVRDLWTGSNAVRFTTFGLEHSSFALTKSFCIDNSDSANIYRSFKH